MANDQRKYVPKRTVAPASITASKGGEPPRRLWQCSGCGYVTAGDVGHCKGYCYDASGESCDAVACLKCGRFHYWTGSIKPEDVVKFNEEEGQAGAVPSPVIGEA